jgi:transposase-like protein
MMTVAFKGSHFERDVILWGVRWYVAYPISYRQIEEMMGERGVAVDHSTLHRWVLNMCRLWRRRSWRASAQWAAAGDWMRLM